MIKYKRKQGKKEHTKDEEKCNARGCKRERERELQFRKIREDNKGKKAFIEDRKKTEYI